MFRKGVWTWDYPHGDLMYIPPGDYTPGSILDTTGFTRLTREMYDELKEFIAKKDPEGIVTTDRTEDLKIIHKLLDIVHDGVKHV